MSAISITPRAFSTPPDLAGPGGDIAGWFTRPAGVALQFVRPAKATVAQVEWMLGPADAAFRARFPGEKQLLFVLDLSNMVERDPAARALMLRRAPMYSAGMSTYVIPPSSMHRILVMSVTAGAMLMRSLGIPVEVRASFGEVQRELRLTHAPV